MASNHQVVGATPTGIAKLYYYGSLCYNKYMSRIALIASLTLLLNGCATIRNDPREISNITTFHPSERTTVFFVCEKYYRVNDPKHEHEHLHCDGKQLLNFKFVF